MRSVQGLLFIGIALFLIWLGVTGRFEKIAQAIGVLRSPSGGAGGTVLPMTGATIYPSPIGPGLP